MLITDEKQNLPMTGKKQRRCLGCGRHLEPVRTVHTVRDILQLTTAGRRMSLCSRMPINLVENTTTQIIIPCKLLIAMPKKTFKLIVKMPFP